MDGLLAPVPVSASRVGFSALRMEPCWTALGQAAGVAAAMAVQEGIEVRAVSVPRLQSRLWDLGAMTVYISDLAETVRIPRPSWDPPGSFPAAIHPWPIRSPWFKAAQFFGTLGLFHDLVDPTTAPDERSQRTTGQWSTAFPHHAVGFKQAIESSLAEKWAAAIRMKLSGDLMPDGRLTRGEFLNRLYRQVSR